jgi:hypothetical protein
LWIGPRNFTSEDPAAARTVKNDVTMSVAAGIRGRITQRLDARAELRVRGFGWSLVGSTAEWTGGLALRLYRVTRA